MRIYVGNVSFETTQQEITEFLETKIGPIKNIVYVQDRASGKFRGVCFVDFINDGDGQRSIDELDGVNFKGRQLNVAEARPRPARPVRY